MTGKCLQNVDVDVIRAREQSQKFVNENMKIIYLK